MTTEEEIGKAIEGLSGKRVREGEWVLGGCVVVLRGDTLLMEAERHYVGRLWTMPVHLPLPSKDWHWEFIRGLSVSLPRIGDPGPESITEYVRPRRTMAYSVNEGKTNPATTPHRKRRT